MAEVSDLGAEALPNEVLTEILGRLPTKSVGRFRCVSRRWSAVLSSDYFIDLHRQRANKPDCPRLLLTANGSNYDDYLYSWQPGGDGAVEKLMRNDFGLQEVVTKPCRGLVLLRASDYSGGGYYVVNPCSGEALALPDSQVPFKTAFKTSGRRTSVVPPCYLRVSYGLGYCTTRKEYKVVRLFSNLLSGPEPGDGGGGFTPTMCEVFVLGTTYWRPGAEISPLCSVSQLNPAVFLDGYLHFLCFDGGIITFSIGDETFGSLPPPSGFSHVATSVLTELDGRLCVCHGEPDSDDPLVLCVYYNKEAQWEKLCWIDRTAWPESERMLLKSLWIAPVGVYYSTAGDLRIMFGTGSCKVFAVDSNGGGHPEILFTPEDTIIGSCEDDCLPIIGLYEERLVSLGRTIENMSFSSPTAAAWFNILKWLPARSLSELRMVCREWRGMIMSDCFISSHYIHANFSKRFPLRIMFIDDPSLGHYVHLEECIRDPSLLMPMTPEFVVCSQPCHGLNVGTWSHKDYFISNPFMRYHQQITFDDGNDKFFAGGIGLGYNSEVDKHILVHINYKEKNLETRSYELKCCMKYVDGEEWYSIDPPPRPVAPVQPTFINGKIYWIVEPNLGPVSTRCEIIEFDIKTMEFEVLQGPLCTCGVGHMTILELYGTLCVSYSGKSRNTINLWMMKDVGIWLMEYHIVLDELSEKAAPLAVDPTDGRILLNTGLSLVYYDPKTAAFETLIITEGIPGYPDYAIYPIVCHDSLVCPLQ